MRAVAVLVVFANHLFDWPPGGFVGVDVFFVLSGFFITGILIRETTTTRTLSFPNFYIRRVKRILPSALLVLTVTVIGSYLLFPAIRARATIVDALNAAVFASNFRFEAVGADYFHRGQPPSPLQHYWSLSIEEQFYFVWPALLVLIFALTRGLRRSGKRRAGQWGLLGAMAVIVAASFAWAMFLSADDPNRAYFSSFTRVWELGVGALVAIAGPWLVRIPSPIRPTLAYLGLAGVVASLFLIDSTVQFPAPWVALPVLSTALMAGAFHGAEVHSMSPLTNAVARWFGDTSYTLYLWHWPVLTLLINVIPKGPLFYGLTFVLSLGLTAVTYHFYENPIRNSDWLLGKPATKARRLPTLNPKIWGLIGGLGAAVIVMSILGIHHVDEISAARELSGAQGEQGQENSFVQRAMKVDRCFGAPAMVTRGCVLRNPDVPLWPSIDNFANDTYHAFDPRCWTENWSEKGQGKLEACDYGYKGSDATRIAFVGDSHAAALLPALWPILDANKWRLTTYLGISCHLANPQPPSPCEKPMAEVEAQLTAHPYDLVLITSFPGGVQPESYQRAWAPIAAAGSRIAVVVDSPRTSEQAVTCLTRVSLGGDRTGECGTSRGEALTQPDPLVVAAQLVPSTTVIDLTPFYCTADRCPSVIGNVIVYRGYQQNDGNSHITGTFATTLAPAIEDGIRRALGVRPTGSR
jgi:peptidoglycan/LPS O-acetylase OafA/YrhL